MEIVTVESALLIWTIFTLAIIGFWIISMADVLRHDFRGNHEKLIWILTVIFMPFLGTILYFIIGRNNRIKDNKY